jgi:hypothetical protein
MLSRTDRTAKYHAFIRPVAKEHCWWGVHGAIPEALLFGHAEQPFIEAPPKQKEASPHSMAMVIH